MLKAKLQLGLTGSPSNLLRSQPGEVTNTGLVRRDRDQIRNSHAATNLTWSAAPVWPLDENGPVDRPFDRMPDSFSSVPAFTHLERITANYGHKLAVSDGSTNLTYSELLHSVRHLACAIAAAVPEDKAVGLLLANSTWYPVAMLAAMLAGRPAVPLNSRDPVQRLAAVVAGARLPAIVSAGLDLAAHWPNSSELRWIDANRCAATEAAAHVEALLPNVSVDSPAVILYTSGSTGVPKGIVNSQRSILQRVQQHVNSCHVGPDDVFMPLTGPATIAGCREMMTPILCGATLYLADIEAAGIRTVRQQMQQRRVTMTYLVPALLRVLMDTTQHDIFSALRVVRIGGEKILWSDVALVRRVVADSCLIQIGYSSTETTGTQWFLPADYPEQGATVPIGFVLPGIEYAIVDDNRHSVAPAEDGELLVKSMHVTLGYWENGQTVPLPPDPDNPRLRIFATGDLVQGDDCGFMRIVGRKGRQIKINGRRVEPAELELVLRRAPHVSDAVAIVTNANEIVAFAVRADGAGADFVSTLREIIRTALPPAVHPTRLHCIPEIPRLGGGKLDGIQLQELDRALSEARDEPSPSEGMASLEIEQAVTCVWKKILNKSTATGRWAEAGGDSLKLLQFVMELETLLGRELRLDSFTIDMSVADIVKAAALRDEGRNWPCVNQDSLPLLFMLPGSIGYGPSLAAFGTEMAKVARVVAVRYPSLDEILAGRGSVSVMAETVLEQIEQAQPNGDVRLIGYSLGGGVAFEVADRLIAAGRSVAFLGILDTNIAPAQHDYRETFARTVQRIKTHRVTIDRMMLRAIAKVALRLRVERLLARVIKHLKWQRVGRIRFILCLELEEVLRMRAFGGWVRQPKARLPLTAILFRCERKGMSPELGWNKLIDKLNVVAVAGGHLDLLVEPHLIHNRPIIQRAFLASGDDWRARP